MIPALSGLTVDAIPAPILVGLGGAAGAVVRHAIDANVSIERVPAAVVVVNVLGTVTAALVGVLALGEAATLLAVVGFSGALTTFSTFALRVVQLWEQGRRVAALALAVGTYGSCLVGVGLALAIGATLG